MQRLFTSSYIAFTLAIPMLFAVEDTELCKGPSPVRIEMKHREFNGIGYNMGYSSLGLFAGRSSWRSPYVPFVDLRAHVFNNGKPACNAGAGLRYLTDRWIYGAYTYYDYRKTTHKHYSQAGVGFERLGERLDLRVNAFIPFGRKRSDRYDLTFDHFSGNRAILRQKREFAMSGCSGEVGYDFLKICKDVELYTAIGPYYFYRSGQNAIGGQLRADFSFFDILTVKGNTSYDPIFKWIGQAELGLSLPLGRKSKGKGQACKSKGLRQRSLRDVERQEIIVTSKEKHYSYAMNPQTLEPYNFIFVNQNSSSLGTFESPYPTLALAESSSLPYDIIYVEPAGVYEAGTSGFSLQNNQKLFGSSTSQMLATTLGNLTIPSYTTGLPCITGGGDNHGMINLGSNNEIAGMHLQNDANTVWVVSGSEAGVFFHDNLIDGFHTNTTDYCDVFNLNSSSGEIVICDNTINVTFGSSISQVSVISLYYFNGGTVVIANNNIASSSSGQTLMAVDFSAGATHLLQMYSNNIQLISQGDVTGLLYTSNSAISTLELYNNSMILTSTGSASTVYGVSAAFNQPGSVPFSGNIYANNILLSTNTDATGVYIASVTGSPLKIWGNTVNIEQTQSTSGQLHGIALYQNTTSPASVFSNTIEIYSPSTLSTMSGVYMADLIDPTSFSIASNAIVLEGGNPGGGSNYFTGIDGYGSTGLAGAIFYNNISVLGDSGGNNLAIDPPGSSMVVYDNVTYVQYP